MQKRLCCACYSLILKEKEDVFMHRKLPLLRCEF